MYVNGSLTGTVIPTRKFRIGATVAAGQIVMKELSTPAAQIVPATATSYPNAVGVAYEAGTYAVASPGVSVKCSYTPDQIVRGKVSGGTAADTAWADDQLLTQDTASTTVITDTGVGDHDYIGGLMVSLAGASKGDLRTILSQTDTTLTTVTVPFSSAIAIGGTALRLYDMGVSFIALTTDFKQWNNLIAAGETMGTNPAAGWAIVFDVIIDGSRCGGNTKINILNPTAPQVEYECVFIDHLFKSVA
jgi:hypothetical protein